MNNRPKKLFLVILDGFGLSEKSEGNAIRAAKPEFLEKLFNDRPNTRLVCSGPSVGLPEGLMGNSEVGHLTIGAGRIVPQDILRINAAIEDRSLADNQTLKSFYAQIRESGKALHMLGLLSTGGVHSHLPHLVALLRIAKEQGLEKVFIHAFTDGRDTSPTSGVHFMKELTDHLAELGIGKVASISGRFYAMDRDLRWDRTEKSYLAMVHGVGNRSSDPVIAIEASYKGNVTDEFILPVVLEAGGQPVATITDGDAVLCWNFRPDRMRQLVKSFSDDPFDDFKRREMPLRVMTLTRYDATFPATVLFPPIPIADTFGEVISQAGLAQFRGAEAEKFAHVTRSLNGGHEAPFPLEDRQMVPSPKVKTYDLKPEMSAFELGELLMEKLHSQRYPVIIANFANCDMVGHTGNFKAAVDAVNAVDCVLSKVIPVAYDLGYDCAITGDHGNAEQMIDEKTGEPFPENTTNPVPFCLLSREAWDLRDEGKLSDIAPTLLDLLGLPRPAAMDGISLLRKKA